METNCIHIKLSADTDYKRAVFDISAKHASKKDSAKFVMTMRRQAVMRWRDHR